MRLSKTISTFLLITVIAMGYVHQHVEIITLGYTMQDNRRYISGLVDRNAKLLYNLSKLESPRALLSSLNTERVEFARQRPELHQNDTVNNGGTAVSAAGSLFGRFFDALTVKAEAKARE